MRGEWPRENDDSAFLPPRGNELARRTTNGASPGTYLTSSSSCFTRSLSALDAPGVVSASSSHPSHAMRTTSTSAWWPPLVPSLLLLADPRVTVDAEIGAMAAGFAHHHEAPLTVLKGDVRTALDGWSLHHDPTALDILVSPSTSAF